MSEREREIGRGRGREGERERENDKIIHYVMCMCFNELSPLES